MQHPAFADCCFNHSIQGALQMQTGESNVSPRSGGRRIDSHARNPYK
jgi:hypothetical protein